MDDEKIPPRFRKTKTDKWAVIAPVDDLERVLAADGKIDVQKKSGGWSSFTVVSLGKPFDVDGVKMCYGYSEAEDPPAVASGASGSGRAELETAKGSAASEPRFANYPEPPAGDPAEPLPEFQGSEEDQRVEF